jgi:hypothetical protein
MPKQSPLGKLQTGTREAFKRAQGLAKEGRRLRDRRRSRRIERLAHENDRLKAQNASLRAEFKGFRSTQERIVKLLEDPPKVEIKRRGPGLISLMLVGAGAGLGWMLLGRERSTRLVTTVKRRLSGVTDTHVVHVPDLVEEGRGTSPA